MVYVKFNKNLPGGSAEDFKIVSVHFRYNLSLVKGVAFFWTKPAIYFTYKINNNSIFYV